MKDTEFTKWLRRLRSDRRLTQGMAAKAAGVHFRTWSEWERGKRKPTPDHLVPLARMGGLDVRDLIKMIGGDIEKLARTLEGGVGDGASGRRRAV